MGDAECSGVLVLFGAVVGGENDCWIYGSVFTGFTAVFASNGSDLGISLMFSLDL